MIKPFIFVLKKVMDKQCFIELGSNEPSDRIIQDVREVLRNCFPGIVFGRTLKTAPVDFDFPRPFYNQSGCFTTRLSQEEVLRVLKRIETDHGRTPEDKACGIVKIDIDLLIYDGVRLKEKDLQREYVRAGLEELHCPFI